MTTRYFNNNDSAYQSHTSRRALLRAFTAVPIAAVTISAKSPWGDALTSLHEDYGDAPVILMRTKEGRALSRHRYHTAEEFFPVREPVTRSSWCNYLYWTGITAQLALSSHLLDVGFPDDWNARYVGHRVAKSLAYANATGFAHDDGDMARLAAVLTPYWKWNTGRMFGEPEPDDGGFTPEQIRPLLRALLDRVHDITGHPRPAGWHRDRRAQRIS